MKKCVIISNFVNNDFRKSLLKEKIKLFNEHEIDVILASSDPMQVYDGVKNYITINHVRNATYITEGIYPVVTIDNVDFFRTLFNNKICYLNYFINLFKISFNYAKNLGYDFCYFIEFDVLINKNHHNFIFNEIDTTKVYFYTLGNENTYQTCFFYGSLEILTSHLTDDKLNYFELFSKKDRTDSNEHLIYLLLHKHKDVVSLNFDENYIFEKRNMFSSNNQAEVYYNPKNKNYLFLAHKGDYCDNIFSVELFEENNLIYHGTFSVYLSFYLYTLKNNTNYTIKYYDDIISESTIYKTSNIYTDPLKTINPNNFIEYRDSYL